MSISPELTQNPEGLLVLSESKATELSDALTPYATSAHDFSAVIEVLSRTNQLSSPEDQKYTVHLSAPDLDALLATPDVDNELLDELYDNPPVILKDMLGALTRIHANQDGKKATGKRHTSSQERNLVAGITALSNLFLILHKSTAVTQARGIWVR